MRHVDAKIKILLVLFYYYNFTFVSIMNCDRQKFSIVTLHESKVHYAGKTTVAEKSISSCRPYKNGPDYIKLKEEVEFLKKLSKCIQILTV